MVPREHRLRTSTREAATACRKAERAADSRASPVLHPRRSAPRPDQNRWHQRRPPIPPVRGADHEDRARVLICPRARARSRLSETGAPLRRGSIFCNSIELVAAIRNRSDRLAWAELRRYGTRLCLDIGLLWSKILSAPI